MPYGEAPKGAGTRLMGGATPRPPSRVEAQRSPTRPPISPVRTNQAAPPPQRPQMPQMPGPQMPRGIQLNYQPGGQGQLPQLGVMPQPGFQPPNMGPPPGFTPPMGQFPPNPGMGMGMMGQQQAPPMNPQVLQLLMQLLGRGQGGRGF